MSNPSLFSTLYIFKDRLHGSASTEVKIFSDNPACLGRTSYSIKNINNAFENDTNPVALLKRMVWMMDYLQTGYHAGKYEGLAGEYKYAAEEYPEKYEALVTGLSQKTLKIIREGDFSDTAGKIPADIGLKFYSTLIKDKAYLVGSPNKNTLERQQHKTIVSP